MASYHWMSFLISLFMVIQLTQCQEITMVDVIRLSAGSLFSSQEEAPYNLVAKSSNYQERRYRPANWACKSAPMANYDDDTDAFLDLFKYILGANSAKAEMKMATPVSLEPMANSAKIEMCFFIGSKFQADPPAPTNPNVYLKRRPAMTVFTSEFGGFALTQKAWTDQTKKLMKNLHGEGKTFSRSQFYWNAFDSPIKLLNRRNEIWVVKS